MDKKSTLTPPEFFATVLPEEPTNVSKLVGAVIRQTIGHGVGEWETTREEIQARAGIGSKSGVTTAIHQAREKGYLVTRQIADGPPDIALRLRWQGEAPDVPIIEHGFTGDLSGYVYLLEGPAGHFKIGCAKDPGKRVSAFLGLATMIHCFPASDMYAAEKLLHQQLAEKRTQGEWFLLDRSDVDMLTDILGYEGGRFYSINVSEQPHD